MADFRFHFIASPYWAGDLRMIFDDKKIKFCNLIHTDVHYVCKGKHVLARHVKDLFRLQMLLRCVCTCTLHALVHAYIHTNMCTYVHT